MPKRFRFKTDIVKRYLNGENTYQIAKSEGCSKRTVLLELGRKGIKRRPRRINFQFKTNVAKRYLDGESSRKIAKSEGCVHMTVLAELERRSIKRRSRRDATEFHFKTDIFKRYLDGENAIQIAKNEGCNMNTVRHRLIKKGIKMRAEGGGKHWTKEEDELLRNIWLNPSISVREIAKKLNRSKYAVINRAREKRLKEAYNRPDIYRNKICQKCKKEYTPTAGGPQRYCLKCGKENVKKRRRKYWTRRYYTKQRVNPKYRLDKAMSELIRQSLKNKKGGWRWEKLVGYTRNDLVQHLEKQFTPKMNWQNYGIYWEVDHIKPRSKFKYISFEEQEFKDCWALENLQPLGKKENLKKSNKY